MVFVSTAALDDHALIVDDQSGVLLINDADVVEADIITVDNGILHAVDAVLRPPLGLVATLNNRGYTTLAQALQQDEDLPLPGFGDFDCLCAK